MPLVAEPLVHNKETTVQKPAIPTYGESLRHSCYPAFLAAERVYETLDNAEPRSRSDRLRSCRSVAWFFRHVSTGEVRVGSNACHLRWCPVCSRSRQNYISHSVAEWISHADHPKLLTLTLKHSEADLNYQVKCLYNYFRELRRRKEIRKRVKGGIWFFQIKKSETDGLWHPHLHCLLEGMYIAQRGLSRMWCQVTFGSTIVDIRAIRDPQKAANDAARYAASPGTLVGLSHTNACELVTAMHGRRICGTWGTGRAVSLRPAKQTDKKDWQTVGSWFQVLGKRDTEPNAKAILNAWRDKKPLEPGITLIEPLISPFKTKRIEMLWDTLDEVHKPGKEPP